MSCQVPASLAIALSACVTVEGSLTHVETRQATGECREGAPAAEVMPGGDRVVLLFHKVSRCDVAPGAVYRVERHRRLDPGWRTGMSVAAGLAVVGAVWVALAREQQPEPYSVWVQHAGERNLTSTLITMAGAAGVAAVGLLTHALLSAVAVPLQSQERVFDGEPAPPHLEPAVGSISGRGLTPLGETDAAGSLTLPLEAAASVAGGELYVDGRKADLLVGSAGRLAALPACREALEPDAAFERRLSAAERCTDGGWSFAGAVLRTLRAPHEASH